MLIMVLIVFLMKHQAVARCLLGPEKFSGPGFEPKLEYLRGDASCSCATYQELEDPDPVSVKNTCAPFSAWHNGASRRALAQDDSLDILEIS